MECFNLLELHDYLQNTTPEPGRAQIKAHLVECLDCHKSLRWLKLVHTTAAEDHSFDFPEEVIAAIVARFKELTATDRRTIRQYIAELIFDSGLLPGFAHVRVPSKQVERRQVFYQAEGYDIDLLFIFSRADDDEQLTGQVVRKQRDAIELAPFKVELLQHGSVVFATNTDKHGIFGFAQLMSEICDLKISVPEGEINLERVPTARSL